MRIPAETDGHKCHSNFELGFQKPGLNNNKVLLKLRLTNVYVVLGSGRVTRLVD